MEANHNNLSPKVHIGLPFEVLGIVFAYYGETETLLRPLETLLLVSRLWNLAALGYSALWGNLHIHLGHKPTHDAWRFILPRRLKRAGSAPLSIEIRYAMEGVGHPYYELKSTCPWGEMGFLKTEHCSCAKGAEVCAGNLLKILTGTKGEYCKRWKSLHISLGVPSARQQGHEPNYFHSMILCNPLSYPMPLLESIHLKHIKALKSISEPLFSSIPSVRSVHLEHCNFESLDGANFSSAESITIRNISIENGSLKLLQFNPPTAIKVIHVDMVYFPFLKIGRLLPYLHTLHIGEYVNDLIAPDADFPSLVTLTVPVSLAYDPAGSMFEKFTSSTNHPLSTVRFLTLSQTRSFSQQLLVGLKPFLEELDSIERITAGREVLTLTLKYIFEANIQREGSRIWNNLSGRTLELVNSDTGSVMQFLFDETMQGVDICAAGRILSIPDSMIPWERCLEDLHLEF